MEILSLMAASVCAGFKRFMLSATVSSSFEGVLMIQKEVEPCEVEVK